MHRNRYKRKNPCASKMRRASAPERNVTKLCADACAAEARRATGKTMRGASSTGTAKATRTFFEARASVRYTIAASTDSNSIAASAPRASTVETMRGATTSHAPARVSQPRASMPSGTLVLQRVHLLRVGGEKDVHARARPDLPCELARGAERKRDRRSPGPLPRRADLQHRLRGARRCVDGDARVLVLRAARGRHEKKGADR